MRWYLLMFLVLYLLSRRSLHYFHVYFPFLCLFCSKRYKDVNPNKKFFHKLVFKRIRTETSLYAYHINPNVGRTSNVRRIVTPNTLAPKWAQATLSESNVLGSGNVPGPIFFTTNRLRHFALFWEFFQDFMWVHQYVILIQYILFWI